jgi:glycosyltransferase involved in cell wall biosynthesis
MKPLVSIIVPCYNQAAYLSEAIESVRRQTYADWECIIINDGSTDNTAEVALDWSRKDSRITAINIPNGGVCAARNHAIREAKGEYILPLDADDILCDNYLAACMDCFDRGEDVKVAYGNLIEFGAINLEWALPDFSFEKLLHKNMIFCTALYRKKDWEAIGGYDEKMKEGLEDWEFWINMLKSGGRAIKNPAAIFYYRAKDVSRNNTVLTDTSRQKRLKEYVFNKHVSLYKAKSHYELYQEVSELRHHIKYPEEYFSYHSLLTAIFKKMKTSLKLFLTSKRSVKK